MHTYTVEDLELSYKADAQKDASGVVQTIIANISSTAKSEAELEAVQKKVDEFKDGVDGRLEEFRAAVIGSSGKLDGEDFRKEVRKKLRGGKEDGEAEEVTVNIHGIIKEIEGTSKLNTKISKVQKEADKVFADSIKLVDNLEKAISKAKDDSGRTSVDYSAKNGGTGKMVVSTAVAPKAAVVASTISRELSAQQAIVNTAISEWTSAVKERDSVYKRVIMRAFSYKQED